MENYGNLPNSIAVQSGLAHLRISTFTVKKLSLLPTLTPSRGLKILIFYHEIFFTTSSLC